MNIHSNIECLKILKQAINHSISNMNVEDGDSFKIVVIGDSGAGKTSVIYRYAKNFFDPSYGTTIGTSFIVKKLNEYNATLNIWDTAGQERYRSMVPMYCHGASAILIIFDVSSHLISDKPEFTITNNFITSNVEANQTLSNNSESNSNSLILSQNDSNENIKSYQEVIDRWLSYVQQTIGDGVPIFIAGNKIDLVNEESVINQFKFTENGNLVENNNFPVFLISAKTGKNINELFDRIATQLIGNNRTKNVINENVLSKSNEDQARKCC